MSKQGDLKTDIRAVLEGDAALMVLLGNPTVTPYSIYFDGPPMALVLPCIVVYLLSAPRDIEVEGALDLGAQQLTINCYAANDGDQDPIAERVIDLLHQKAIGDDGVFGEHAMMNFDKYYSDDACWGRVDTYNLHIGRAR